MKRAVLVLALSAASALAQAEDKHAVHKHGAHQHAAHKPIAGVNSLDVYRDDGVIHLLTGEVADATMTLWHRQSKDGGRSFSLPVRVDDGAPAPRLLRRGEDAQVAARGDLLVAVWTIPGTGWGGRGPLASSVSRDGGRSWKLGATPSDSGLTTGHGLVDLLFDRDGLHAVWLDSRDKAQGLRYAFSKDATHWGANATIQSGTCECCWNSLITRGRELLVLYRGKGPRDMELAALDGGKWTHRARVGAFGWEFKGCPETGGGLAATPDGRLHALVWTGRDGNTGLHRLGSSDAGAKWGRPTRVGGKDAQHGDLTASGNALAAVWDEADGIHGAIAPNGGATWEKPALLSKGGVIATHPRVVPGADGFVVLWTEREKDGPWRLRTAHLRRR